jgi:hypothetical protein
VPADDAPGNALGPALAAGEVAHCDDIRWASKLPPQPNVRKWQILLKKSEVAAGWF